MHSCSTLPFLPALNGLRCLAFGLVLLDHWVPGMHDYAMTGNAGVSLFFVLSGFLISRILIENKKQITLVTGPNHSLSTYLGTFYRRRAWRIFPIYYLTLLYLALVGDLVLLRHGAWFFSYTANVYLIHQAPAHLQHLWSLSAEEQLYLLIPLLIWWCPTKRLPTLAILLIAVSLIYRGSCYYWLPEAVWWPASYCLPFGCLDGYGAGLLLAALFDDEPGRWTRFFSSTRLLHTSLIAWPTVLMLGLLWAIAGNGKFYSPGTAVGLRFSVTLVGVFLIGYAHNPMSWFWRWLLLNPICQYLGRISYGLYLYHNLIFNIHVPNDYPTLVLYRHVRPIVVDWLGPVGASSWLERGFYGLLTVSLASASWFLIEKPLLRAYSQPQTVPATLAS